MIRGFDPGISRFDPCSAGQNSALQHETCNNPSKVPHSHTSPSRLQNERPHAEQIAKNAWQPKCGQSERARSADTALSVVGCAASLLTRPARFAPSRPLSCDADLDRRRDEQNGQAKSRAGAAEARTTANTLEGVERNAPSRRRRGTAWPNSLREAAHVKKPPRTKNNCSSTCWSGGDGLGSPAMITNEARAARTSSPARRRRRFAGAKRGPWSRNLPTRPVR